MKHSDIRNTLLSRTISVIADQGFDGATTRAITGTTGINDAYIYRCFKGKEDLMAEAFATVDEDICRVLNNHTDSKTVDLRAAFADLWRYFLNNPEKTRMYSRYWYSPYYQWNSAERHRETYAPLMEKIQSLLTDGANAELLMQVVLCGMITLALCVFDGSVPDNSKTAEEVGRLAYHAMCSYLRATEEENVL